MGAASSRAKVAQNASPAHEGEDKMRIPLTLLTAAILAGCAATQVAPADQQRPVPAAQVTAMPVASSAQPATVRVTRDVGYIGSMVFMHIGLDGKRLGSLNPGEYVEFKVDPGEHTLSALPASTMNDRHPTIVEVNWRPGATYRYRVGMDGNLAVNIMRMEQP
jgi:hypothetical protein